MTLPPTERLRIFVSSTIEECAAERAVIQNAIESLNHEAVLFEKVGARPHPPREVYRPRLETAHIFVGNLSGIVRLDCGRHDHFRRRR